MASRALIIGGTGPTGLFLVQGLLDRGHRVAIFHRGTHELDEMPREVEHIHGDPHFLESIAESLKGRAFDLVVATYGRIRLVVEAVRNKTGRLIAVTGAPAYLGYFIPGHLKPFGLPVPVPEDAPAVDDPNLHRFSYLIAKTEKTLMDSQKEGQFDVTCFRYPQIYGPRQIKPFEWLIVRRILDRRPHVILPDGGLTLESRGYSENMAHGLLLAVDRPDVSRGKIYNLADERQLTLRQWVESIAAIMNHQWRIVSMPEILAKPAMSLLPFQGPTSHRLLDTRKVRDELGYADKVPVEEGMRRTVQWCLDHPLSREEESRQLQDPFDYEAEDRIIALFDDAVSRIEKAVPFEKAEVSHPYPHPLEPGLKKDHRAR